MIRRPISPNKVVNIINKSDVDITTVDSVIQGPISVGMKCKNCGCSIQITLGVSVNLTCQNCGKRTLSFFMPVTGVLDNSGNSYSWDSGQEVNFNDLGKGFWKVYAVKM